MAGKLPPQDVADAFAKQYYAILNKCPENLHKFYHDVSQHDWQGLDGGVKPVTTLRSIDNKIMSSGYQHCSVEVKNIDAQKSQFGAVLVMVNGCLTWPDKVKKNFCQAFFLAEQEKGYYVLNDILRFFDVCDSKADTPPSHEDESDHSASKLDAVVENEKSMEAVDHSVFKKGNDSVSSDALDKNMTSAAERSSNNEVTSNEKEFPAIAAPASVEKVPSVATQSSSFAPKVSYASILAKVAPVTSPRSAKVIPDVQKLPVASPKYKPPTPASTDNVVPKSPQAGNEAMRDGGRGIYIGGLPYDISKPDILDALKQFGPVRRYPDSIQIRKHEDGFVCGFVEFEYAESASLAVKAHYLHFGNKQAYITFKRSPSSRGKEAGRNSPTQAAPRDVNKTWGTEAKERPPIESQRSEHVLKPVAMQETAPTNDWPSLSRDSFKSTTIA